MVTVELQDTQSNDDNGLPVQEMIGGNGLAPPGIFHLSRLEQRARGHVCECPMPANALTHHFFAEKSSYFFPELSTTSASHFLTRRRLAGAVHSSPVLG